MSKINFDLEGLDRKFHIFTMESVIPMERLRTLYEMANLQVRNYRDSADLKVLQESGSIEDLNYLYEAADESMKDNKKEISGKMTDEAKKMIKKLIKELDDLDEDTDVSAIAGSVEAVIDAAKNLKSAIKTANSKKAPSAIRKEITSVEIPSSVEGKDDSKENVKSFKDALEELKDELDDIEIEDSDTEKCVADKITDLFAFTSDMLKTIAEGEESSDDTKDNNKEDETEKPDEDSSDEKDKEDDSDTENVEESFLEDLFNIIEN